MVNFSGGAIKTNTILIILLFRLQKNMEWNSFPLATATFTIPKCGKIVNYIRDSTQAWLHFMATCQNH